MKTNIKIYTMLIVLLTSCIIYPGKTTAQESNVSFQVFYDELSPYGQWIDYSDYGYVWIPDAGPDFVPYSTDGHWILTDYGWTWDSDYNWGWAAFHYGRWSFSDSFGWFWVPDNEWGPAWVNWRQADGYYGWSPIEPGISLNVSFGREYDNRNDHWMFVRDRDIERRDINLYYLNKADHERIGRRSVVINNTFIDNSRHTTYVSGPSKIQVQKVVGRTITPVIIKENNKPGQDNSNGQLRIYRPQIVKNNNNGRKPTPTRVTNMNDVKRTPVSNSTKQNQIGNPGNRTIPQPVRTIETQKNTPQPNQQRNINQQDNKQSPQNRISSPSNINHNSTPSDINRPIRRPDAITPQNFNNPPVQQRNVTPQNNTPQPVQQQNVTPQNNNPQPVQQQNVTPQNNNPQPAQQRNVTPQNNTPQPIQRNVAPQNNTPQPVQQRNMTPQNNTVQPSQQPRNGNQSKNRPAKQQKSNKQQIKKEQAKIPDAVTDKK